MTFSSKTANMSILNFSSVTSDFFSSEKSEGDRTCRLRGVAFADIQTERCTIKCGQQLIFYNKKKSPNIFQKKYSLENNVFMCGGRLSQYKTMCQFKENMNQFNMLPKISAKMLNGFKVKQKQLHIYVNVIPKCCFSITKFVPKLVSK